jgi:hypothetical protein
LIARRLGKEVIAMPSPTPTQQPLDREFLGIRCRLIELAAAFDRIERTGNSAADDPRMAQIHRSLELLAGNAPTRAEQVQMVFSKRD